MRKTGWAAEITSNSASGAVGGTRKWGRLLVTIVSAARGMGITPSERLLNP
jgi:hypothetical protein